jgi:MFS superfamily sulfate permease-like transporter
MKLITGLGWIAAIIFVVMFIMFGVNNVERGVTCGILICASLLFVIATKLPDKV